MKNLRTLATGILILLVVVAKSQTLKDYLIIASANNPHLKAAYLDFEQAMQHINQAKALSDPKLSVGYFITPIETKTGPQTARISLSQSFPWFGVLKAKEALATKIAEAKYQDFLDKRNRLFLDLKFIYYKIYEVHRHIKIQQEILEILKNYKEITSINYSNSNGLMTDTIRVEIMIEDLQVKIKLLKSKLLPLQVSFNTFLNSSINLPVEISETPINSITTMKIDSIITLSENPKVKSLYLKWESEKHQEKIAKKQRLPQFGLGASYFFIGKNTTATNNAIMPMVSISIPVFRKKYNASIKESQIKQKSLKLEKKWVENKLLSDLQEIKYNLHKNKDYIDLYKRQIKNIQIAINLLYVSYSTSGKDFEELLRMEQKLLDYKIKGITAKKNYFTSLATLNYITSKTQ